MGLNAPPSGPNNPMQRQLEQIVHTTRTSIENLGRRIERLVQQDITNTALGHTPMTFATLPTTTVTGLEYFCSNCRKGGEGPGAGTGLLVFMDGSGTWKNVYNNSAAAA